MIEDPAFVSGIVAVATLALLGVAALHDLGFRTVPNGVAAGLLACGAVRHGVAGDLLPSLAAAGTVFFGGFVVWRVGFVGAGDAKLIGALCFALPRGSAATLLLATALAGGVLACAMLAVRPFMPARPGGPRPTTLLRRVARAEAWRIRRRGPVPYAVAIAAGGVAVLAGG